MRSKTNKASALTVKGQITVPKALRDAFGWKVGTRIDFVREADGVRLVRAGTHAPGAALVRRSKGIASTRMTTGEIMRMTRGD